MINTELHNGDCLEYMKKIPTSSIDLIITDPPYNLGKFMEERDTNLVKMRDNFFGAAGWDDLDYKEWKKSMNKFFHQASRVLKDGGSIIVFMAIIKVETIIQLAQKHGLYYKTTGIWHKSNPMPRNMNLHFVNSTESWIYFTYKTKTGTFNNNGKVLHLVLADYEGQVEFDETKMPVFDADNDDFTLTLYNLNYGTNYATQVNENVIENVIEISEEKMKQLMPEYSKKKLAKAYEILKMISENPNISIDELRIALDVTDRRIARYISELKDKGIIERKGPDNGGKWKIK